MFKLSYDSLLNCNNSGEVGAIGYNFVNEAQTYYDNFNKTVKGEDIGSEIYRVYMEKMQKWGDMFQRAVLKMMK